MLKDFDRKHLAKVYALAKEAREPPKSLPSILEPTWAALIAHGEREENSAIFQPGDNRDAIQKLVITDPEHATLYLSLEPSASYLRLAPVTENIRASGIKRVVIGAEDPSARNRGKGIQSLQKYGIEVLLANGEEARNCQLLYEDYAKVSNKNLPMLKLLWSLSPDPESDISFSQSFHQEKNPLLSDALLISASVLSKTDEPQAVEPWLLVLDAENILDTSYKWIVKNPEQVLIFIPEGAQCKIPGVRSFSVEKRNGFLDLVSVLRYAREWGLYSVLCKGDENLFRSAIIAGLVDSVISFVGAKDGFSETLSRLSRASIQLGKQKDALQLFSPRLLENKNEAIWVEAEIYARKEMRVV